ncbi:MAG: hypothetical protein AAGE96_15740 [Cyanobacteria bacterium P01_G01_bin.19]
MSIDLYIFPTSPEYFYWGELKNKFWELLTLEDRQRLGEISLHQLGSRKIVQENEKIIFLHSKDYNFYYISSDIPSNLGINISRNEPNYVNEIDMLEDFGRNLDAATIQTLIQQWKAVGYGYEVNLVLREKYQTRLFIALAAAIAFLCRGYVININDRFTLDVGVYAPNIFQQAKMNFTLHHN